MNRFVSRYSSSPLALPQEENFNQLCGKWDAAQQLAFPSFDIPAIHNVCFSRVYLSIYRRSKAINTCISNELTHIFTQL